MARDHNFFQLRAVMHAPNDERARNAYQARNFVSLAASTNREQSLEKIDVPLSVIAALNDDEAMLQIYSGTFLRDGRKGSMAGFVLTYLYILETHKVNSGSLNKALHLASKHAEAANKWGDGTSVAKTTRSLRAAWDEFRSVAHLWAAEHLIDHRYRRGSESNFSYETHVVEMIEWSEAFRRWLESFVPFGWHQPLVTRTDVWRPCATYPASGRVLPPPVNDGQLPAELRDWLGGYRAPTPY
jgi:hypothetical protein